MTIVNNHAEMPVVAQLIKKHSSFAASQYSTKLMCHNPQKIVPVLSWMIPSHSLYDTSLYDCSRFRRSCKNRPLVLSCSSFHSYFVLTGLPLDMFATDFILEAFMKVCRETPNFFKIWRQYRSLYVDI